MESKGEVYSTPYHHSLCMDTRNSAFTRHASTKTDDWKAKHLIRRYTNKIGRPTSSLHSFPMVRIVDDPSLRDEVGVLHDLKDYVELHINGDDHELHLDRHR
jgi:hypothetical protein